MPLPPRPPYRSARRRYPLPLSGERWPNRFHQASVYRLAHQWSLPVAWTAAGVIRLHLGYWPYWLEFVVLVLATWTVLRLVAREDL